MELPLPLLEVTLRLIAATVLSGAIGIERELRKKPAGVRTNALIGLGSAVMTLAGLMIFMVHPENADAARVASIIVQGVGFLGAGAIIQSSGSVHGLTTAATMWAVAGIGIACGFGFYALAAIAAVLVLILLGIFGPLDARIMGDESKQEERGIFHKSSEKDIK